MSRIITPVSNSQTFDQWVAATNNVIQAFLTTVTLASNTAGDLSSGNGFITGLFGANTLIATSIRGGNVALSDVLTISSNVNFSGAQANIVANVYITAANIALATNSSVTPVTITSNGSFSRTTIAGDSLNVSSNVAFSGVAFYLPSGNTAQRPAGSAGLFRYNTDTSLLEIYNGSWLTLSAFANGVVTAGLVSFAGNANIAANNVQAAIIETYNEKVSLSGDNMTGNLVINQNGTTLPIGRTGTVLQVASPDGVPGVVSIESFANVAHFVGRRADGLNSAKTALANDDIILSLSAHGYDGNTYLANSDGAIEIRANENLSNTGHGSKVVINLSPIGSTTKTQVLTLTSTLMNVAAAVTFSGNAAVGGNLTVTGVMSGNGVNITTVNAAFLEGHNSGYFSNQAANAAFLSSGVVPAAQIASTGTANSTTWLRGDQAWTALPVGNVASLNTANVSDYRANVASKVLQTDQVWAAAAEVALTDAATIAVDMNAFLNATVTLGGNRTLGNPTNAKPGQAGYIRLNQDGSGSRVITYDTNYKFAGGIKPALSGTAGAIDILYYQVVTSSFIVCSLSRALS